MAEEVPPPDAVQPAQQAITTGPPAPHPPAEPEHPSVRHEKTDASFRAIFTILVVAAVLAVIIHVGIWLFFAGERARQDRAKRSPFPLAQEPSHKLPADPRLEQVDRLADIQKENVYLRQEAREAVLNSYGYTEEKGFVHIPIEKAMQLIENKLPVREELPAEQRRRAGGLVDSGESNSGRVFQEGSR